MTDTQIFEPDGRAIPYATEGDGPAVVLIAGQGLNITYLSPLAGAVAAEDFRVLLIGSRRPPREADAAVSISDLGHDVVDVMDHLAVADAWVGGHAFGGSIARTVSQVHPERVNGVLLLGVEGVSPATNTLDVAEVPERWRDAEVVSMLRSVREEADATPATLAPGIPVLVIQGTEDRIAPLANGEGLQSSAPDRVSVVRIEGGGHMFPATHVGETSWAIEDYLDWD